MEFKYIQEEKDIKRIRIITIIGFLFFFGLRGFAFTDWLSYYPLFEELPPLWTSDFFTIFHNDYYEQFGTDVSQGQLGMEMGFIYFTAILKSFFPNYFLWVFVNSLIDVLILNYFFKKYSRYYVLGFLFFFLFSGVILEFNLMRNIKAIMLFMISIKYLEERRILPYMILNLVGYCFHSSAIVFFPLYFILHKQWSPKLLWGIFIVGNIIYLLQIQYLTPFISFFANIVGGRLLLITEIYLQSDLYSRAYGISIGYIERISTFLLVMYYRQKLIENNSTNIIFINLFILYFICYFFFTEIIIVVERVSLLFALSYWVLYPYLIDCFDKIKIKITVICIFILYGSVKIVKLYSDILSRYDNVLFGIESFESRQQKVDKYIDVILEGK
jgi:hypothetical protein